MTLRLWPRSLQGQLLLAIALALLLAQGIGAALLYRSQADRREAALIHTAAFRIYAALQPTGSNFRYRRGLPPPMVLGGPESFVSTRTQQPPLRAGDLRLPEAEQVLRGILTNQGLELGNVLVVQRPRVRDELATRRAERRFGLDGNGRKAMRDVMVAGVQLRGQTEWMVARVVIPRTAAWPIMSLIAQTLLSYAVLVGAIALILRRITRPLAALTSRMDSFAQHRDPAGQLIPEGPDDIRHLIIAHNALEARISGLLDEKDVMLGAIGHDLKTPLAALRVRIESVPDETERAKMAATIEDLSRSLDDILSLARVGRPSDPLEPTELAALVAQIIEEFEDIGAPVTLIASERLVMPLRATWLRRALRNLISNALRYGKTARVSLQREGTAAVIRIEDDGPGIPLAEMDRMLEPFTRGDPSRNSNTGGAGLGLTLARAIAQQHGGQLELANRSNATGLVVTLRLPLG